MFSNKKQFFYCGWFLLMIQVSLSAQPTKVQTQPFDSLNRLITDAMLTVDAQKLSNTFHDKIDLSLTDNQGIYSHSQAQFILSGFFKKFPVRSYQIISQNITNNSNFVVGIMHSTNQHFRVCYLIKQEPVKPEVYQFTIEK